MQGESKEYLMYNRLIKDTNLELWDRLVARIRQVRARDETEHSQGSGDRRVLRWWLRWGG
jgi:hypothetical protein